MATRKAASRRPSAARKASPRAQAAAIAASVRLTHPDRVVFPGTDITKGDVADYVIAAMPWLLPEIANRPLSVLRCPDGAAGACFFQKHDAERLGESVRSISLREADGGMADYLYVDNARGVLELVQMNTLEFHPWGARVDDPDRPDRLVFDLDPAPGIDWKTLIAGARDVRAAIEAAGLESFVRVTGGKGVHVVVPFRRGPSWGDAKTFCETIARTLAEERPDRYLASASKSRREGRIFIDWLRNTRGATSVAGWSPRARPGAPVAMPVRWDELARIDGPHAYDIVAARRRAASLRKDPWEGFSKLSQSLPRSR